MVVMQSARARLSGLKRPTRRDVLFTAFVGVVVACLALFGGVGESAHRPDVFGWGLLFVMVAVLAWRRHYPMAVFLVSVLPEAPYHILDNIHSAPTPTMMVAVYSLAVAGPRLRTLLITCGLVVLAVTMLTLHNADQGADLLRNSGWVMSVALLGEAVRVHRNYVGAIVERAERAERTREETAARRVAEERLRIAQDLHDLLAHSITLIGVQTSVAAHLLVADPGRLDRAALADALDGIAGTCRDSRAELRTTLQVLRGGDSVDGTRPPPGLAGLDDLAAAARSGGAEVRLDVADAAVDVPRGVGAAAYRIVQQSLTNAVQHAGSAVHVRISVTYDEGAGELRIAVVDDGPAHPEKAAAAAAGAGAHPGYGIVGMRERARSVGGTLEAARRTDAAGFAVTAVLPCVPAGPDGVETVEADPAGPAAPAEPAAGDHAAPADRPGARTAFTDRSRTA
ncbi:two-component sensor histidine kinase [Streptomyces sp. WAC 06738]|uniref:sensor histidine kinase n=1 Tax=Streptomyces sp. WAC 06738 TaxID=2203210 RepID=UPI000F718B88|nr:histidine kinase [Streptomyces sp. WAC 06738]AZM45988.1 two-component sensor histidine kinase [Streptomyces sp. WAC 06738]